jgi:subtilisin family serine protease
MKLMVIVFLNSMFTLFSHAQAEALDQNRNNVDFVSSGQENKFPVAVIDSGIDYTHSALADKLHKNLQTTPMLIETFNVKDDTFGFDFNENDNRAFDNNYVGYTPKFVEQEKGKNSFFDYLEVIGKNALEVIKTILAIGSPGHGTHVAGIVVEQCEDTCSIVPVKVFGSEPPILKRLASALEYSQRRGYKIVNMSLGVDSRYFTNANSGEKAYLEKIRNIIRSSTNTLFIIAAGNDSLNLADPLRQVYPATFDLPNMITVGAVDNSGKLASFSNFHETIVHVFAPGVEIESTWNDGMYKTISGTSMSTPYVSGKLAKLWSQNPKLSALEIRKKFLEQVPIREVIFEEKSYSVPVLLD